MTAPSHVASGGVISRGIARNTFIEKTITFVEGQLPKWRDDETRVSLESEEELNGQLCKFLNDRARHEFPMAMFHHEEKQGKRRRVDLSVVPSSKAIQAALYDSIYVPFLVIEGKRLPAPTASREREYVTGLGDQSGGVQRFRLCLHGKSLSVAMLVGYVQRGDTEEWRSSINNWIEALTASGEDKTCKWVMNDALGELTNGGTSHTCRCESNHARSNGAGIRLVHLWICMWFKPSTRNA